MKITDIRINGIREPLGFELSRVTVSWKVTEAESTEAAGEKLTVAEDAAFEHILFEKAGEKLRRIGETAALSLRPRTRYHVRVEVTGNKGETAVGETFFETGKAGETYSAQWITAAEEDRFHPQFFKTFTLAGKPVSARLYASGLGLYEASLNGTKCGSEFLAPLYSDYGAYVQVQTYDVTDALREGENVLDFICGNGWYKGRLGYSGAKEIFGDRFQILAELHVLLADGTEQVISSGADWSYRGSDFEYSDLYDGEGLNRLLWEGKENPAKPAVLSGIAPAVRDRLALPVVVKDTLPVCEVIHTPAGETVLDFGQNFTGTVEYKADLPKGTRIVLDHGEILQDGNFYNDNYRTAKVKMIYVSGGKAETVRAHFSYFGFRYVRVTGWPGELDPSLFRGLVLYSDLDTAVSFRSSDKKLDRLQKNAFWGQRSNFLDLPTDCPQRDERLGWTGDANAFSATACYQMDTRAFYRKYLTELRIEQQKNGGVVPHYVPNFDHAPGGSSVWSDAASFIPMNMYESYGDEEALREQYPLMHDWAEWVIRQDDEHGGHRLWNFGFHFGDWLAQDGITSQSMKGGTDDFFVASFYYYGTVSRLARAADILGYEEDRARYAAIAEEIRSAILDEYFAPSGRLASDTQTSYLLCLAFGIYRDKQRILDGLRLRLKKDNWSIKGGFVGATMMCRVLAENSMEDLASYFLFQKGFPGWMHCVDLGATTIWERWNSVLDDGHISGTGMNSLNHYSYGSVMEYVYRDLAGIRSAAPGFTRVSFAPQFTHRLRELEVKYDSVSGEYSSYRRLNDDGSVTLRFSVPFGCSAELVLPGEEKIELTAGSFEKTWRPEKNYLLKYGIDSRLGEVTDDEEALAVLREDFPMLAGIIAGGDKEFLGMTFREVGFMFFMGFDPQMVADGTKRLFTLKA